MGALTGCDRQSIRTYTVPKEEIPTPPPAQSATAAVPARPSVTWSLPEGWEELEPNQFRVGNFRVPGEGDAAAEVSIIPLPGRAGSDLANVNRWRGQVGLPPVVEADLARLGSTITIDGQDSRLFEFAGTSPGEGEPVRMLAAISRRGGTAWFVKMLGPDKLVAGQKEVFGKFLAGLKFGGATAGAKASAAPAAAAAGTGQPQWQPPADWQAGAPGSMQTAVWNIAGEGGAKATVSVSVLGGAGGGLLPNVIRWRRQMGLPPITADQLGACTAPLAGLPAGATLVTLEAADGARKMLGAVVPAGNQTWFYKLVGAAAVVDGQKDAFTQFVTTAHHAR